MEFTDWVWPPEATVEWFTAFIAADARGVSDEEIRSLAKAMLAQRCAYLTAWGPDSGRVHGNFDLAYVEWPTHRTVRRWGRWRTTWSEEIPHLATTDREDEPLASALWYAKFCAWPGDLGYTEDRIPTLVALVEPPFRDDVRALLLDPQRLDREAGVEEE
ncbi:MAG TPA: hypothetical protein VLU96_07845 [Gaiellaceae bacterium]|nr:hypothetical protein [Gaiellaceae bacterium]